MRPLYLQSSTPVRVLLDGPALLIRCPSRADRRFPLPRISRVIANDSTEWSMSALMACADEGITVSFLRNDGTLRSRWMGCLTDRSTFSQYWNDFVDRPNWQEEYSQWRRALRIRSIRVCAFRMGWSAYRDARAAVEAAMEYTSAIVSFGELCRIKKVLYGLAQCRALAELHRLRIQPDICDILLPDFVLAIQWGLHPDLCRWLERYRRDNVDALPNDRDLTKFFEENAGRSILWCVTHFADSEVDYGNCCNA